MVQTEFPKSLALDEWLWFSLESVDATERRLALEEIALNPLTPPLLERLEKISTSDPEEACRAAASGILANRRAAESAKEILPNLQLSPDTLGHFLEDATPALRRAILKSLRTPPPESLLDLWRNDLLNGGSLEKTETALIGLTRFGKPADAVFALSLLGAEQPAIIRAALDLLLAQDAGLFKESVASALVSGHTDVRLHAVRQLRNIDPGEALAFLESLVLSEEPVIRLKALHELLLIPFDVAEPTYMRFLGAETRPLLLVLVSLAVSFNPHPDLPLKLYDILLVSKGVKKTILQAGFNQLLECITAAGILTVSCDEYVADLKARLIRRRETLIINLSARDLTSPEQAIRVSAVERLRPYASRPEVGDMLRKRIAVERDDEVRSMLASLVGQEQPAPAETLEKALESGNFDTLPLPKQQGLLKGLNTQELFRAARPRVKILLDGKPHRSILLEVIHLFGEFGEAADIECLAPYLRHGAPPAVIAAAVKACGKLDIDHILPTLSRLLQQDDPRVRSAALEVFIRADKEGAISHLTTMARSAQPVIRRQALHLFPLFDFTSVESLLERMFAEDPQDELKIQAGFMIAANPSMRGLKTLCRGCFNEKSEQKEGFGELWESAVQGAARVLNKEPKALMEECIREMARDREAAKTPAPTYAYKKVVGKTPYVAAAKQEQSAGLAARIREHRGVLLALVLILAPAAYLFLFPSPERFDTGGVPTVDAPAQSGSASTPGRGDGISGLTSNARSVLGGKGYQKLMKGVSDELSEYSKTCERKRIERLAKRANSADVPLTERLGAVSAANPLLLQARADIAQKKHSEAREALLKIARDPSATPMEKVLARQGLVSISAVSGEKLEETAGNVDGFLSEFMKLHGDPNITLPSFGGEIRKVSPSMEVFRDPGKKSQLSSRLSKEMSISPADAEKQVDGMFKVLAGSPE